MSAQVNQKAYTLLAAFATGLGSAVVAVEKAKAKLDSVKEKAAEPYTNAILAAIEAKTADVLEATFESLFDNIRHNRGGIATKMRAKKRDEVSSKGETHTIPSSLSTAKTVLMFSLERGIPLTLDGEVRSFGSIRDEKRDILAQEAKDKADKEEAARIANATPDELARIAALAAVKSLAEAVPHMSQSWAEEVTKFCAAAVSESIKEAAKAADAVARAAAALTNGEKGAGNELAEALKKRDARKGRKAA